MQKKLTVKDILDSKGKNKLAEVYTHYSYEAEACELAGIDMIISSENNDVISIRNAAPNTFFTVGLQYGIHLNGNILNVIGHSNSNLIELCDHPGNAKNIIINFEDNFKIEF